jgi:hypothetical protein
MNCGSRRRTSRQILKVVDSAGGTAKAAISAVLPERIHSMIGCSLFLIAEVAPTGERVKECVILIRTS